MSANVTFFGRSYEITLSAPKSATGWRFGNTIAAQSALRVAFEVKRDSLQTPNTGKITLYNLNPQLRASITEGWQVTLSAGYSGFVDQIFSGEVASASASRGASETMTVSTTRQGPDIATQLQAIDGGTSLLNASFNRAYPAGTTLAHILKDVGKAMAVQPGVAVGVPNYALTRSQTLSGGCTQVLHALLDRHGIEFSVQNGKLNMIPKGQNLGKTAVVVSQNSGMINVPSSTSAAAKFESLLNPMLVPGQLAEIQSQSAQASGYYTVRTATFEGDSHGDAWKVTCECERVVDTVLELAPAHGFDYSSAVVPGLL